MVRRRLGFWRRFAVMTVKPMISVLTRRTWRGMEHIPAEGGVIIVVNHISHADPLAVAHYIYDAGRWPSFLAKSGLFEVPVLGYLLKEVHQIPVRRGTTDAVKALEAARAGVRAGEAVVIYPEGTTTREPDLWPMRGKTGAARLWLDTRAPMIPIVMWGPEEIYDPRSKKLKLFPRAKVTIVSGEPLDLSAWADAQPTAQVLNEITEHIMLHLRDMLVEIRGGSAPPLWAPKRPVQRPEEQAA
ncbi:lysophospholipid acyltransferase family protein [Dactylosporangium matsuzakiense]|uniref:1-acyl-sn-glycerol-3-phosphate acyltransferase n=1 Tax=Dactylosporangium matsuzakiense TaxID=53360 RepID=A0A9W6KH51_9ACTN|nr:lysophospholipid acyltransferase family protein [Dactylosporangium matsuzakiense]UWZ46299.1 1-acyl-sn-glycerol-3-phosphate acyltransferase [Dactylosporangium matsuzakiense]GLL01996.1 1-acyl-sn-glycerol-3-phosphate acyltransferase [Dactylosporangium matsuzakiense]